MSTELTPTARRVACFALLALLTGILPAAWPVPAAAADPPTSALSLSSVPVLAVSASGHSTCAIREDGTLACWGNNDYGQAVPPAGTFTAVSGPCAIRDDGSLACWGINPYGPATPPEGGFTALSGPCAIREEGTLACWGTNDFGPEDVPTGSFSALSATWYGGCAIRATDGSLDCWAGQNWGQGQPPDGSFAAVSTSGRHTCAIRADDGTLVCWGIDDGGQATPPPGVFTAVSAGMDFTCAIGADDGLACWGSEGAPWATPPAGAFSAVSAGMLHACAIRAADGLPTCWGTNDYGAVTPAPVPSLDPLPRWLASRRVPVSWTAVPAFAPVCSYDVRYRRAPWNGGFGEWHTLVTGTTAMGWSFRGKPGTYCYSVRAADTGGGVSPWTAWPGCANCVHPPGTLSTCTSIPLDDRALTRSRGWTAGTGSAFYRDTFLRTTQKGATLRRTDVRGLSLALLATTCPTCGSVRIYSGSTAIKTISLYSPTRSDRALIPIRTFAATHPRTITIKVVSSGKKVIIDGLAVRRIE